MRTAAALLAAIVFVLTAFKALENAFDHGVFGMLPYIFVLSASGVVAILACPGEIHPRSGHSRYVNNSRSLDEPIPKRKTSR